MPRGRGNEVRALTLRCATVMWGGGGGGCTWGRGVGVTGKGNARGECEGKIIMAAMRQPCDSNQVVRV